MIEASPSAEVILITNCLVLLNASIVLLCEDLSAFSYISLRAELTELVRVIRVDDDGQLICRLVSTVNEAASLQQQMQHIYTTGTLYVIIIIEGSPFWSIAVSMSHLGRC